MVKENEKYKREREREKCPRVVAIGSEKATKQPVLAGRLTVGSVCTVQEEQHETSGCSNNN